MQNERVSELLWSATFEELLQGFQYDSSVRRYRCILCGYESEAGVIYPAGETGLYWDAEKWMREHVAGEHGSVFYHLLHLNKRWTGLSDVQKQMLQYFYEGMNDEQIVKQLGGGSASTIRNHRFTLREKHKQAKLFLVLMELMERQKASKTTAASGKAKESANRNSIEQVKNGVEDTELQHYFPDGFEGPLRKWPNKESQRVDVARLLQGRFQPGKRYTEPEVNHILEQAHPDYASLRRYMVEYGFMDRQDDGSSYWVEPVEDDEPQEKGKKSMDKEKRKELVTAYMETDRPMGVYRITNHKNGKMWIGSSPNLDAIAKRHQFELKMGMFRSKAMQMDYNEVGEAEFHFEVLERLKQRKDGYQDIRHELAGLEAKWIEQLQPYGERGYHEAPKPTKDQY